MSDYIDTLEQTLRDAAAREDRTQSRAAGPHTAQGEINCGEVRAATPARRRLNRRWSTLAVAAAVVVAGGSATGAITTLVDTQSSPLSGPVPGFSARLLGYDIPITPDLEPGHAGWCSYPVFSVRNGATDATGGGTCSPAGPPGAPVILGGGEPISNERDLLRRARHTLGERQGQITLFWMVVSSRVAAVRLGPGDVVRSRPDPRLPAGWRAVVAFVPGQTLSLEPIPLDSAGRPIVQRDTAARHPSSRSGEVAAVRSYAPGASALSPCSIRPTRLPGVTAQWGLVATSAPRLKSAVASNVLFSCARSWFSIKGQSQAPSAAILLNARDPRRPAPPPPGLRPTGQPGVFRNVSAHIVAKRVGRAWLIVQGNSVPLSTLLLSTLRVGGANFPPRSNRR